MQLPAKRSNRWFKSSSVLQILLVSSVGRAIPSYGKGHWFESSTNDQNLEVDMARYKEFTRSTIAAMQYGVARREALLQWMRDGYSDYCNNEYTLNGLPVNCKHVSWFTTDPDIKYLLKHKKIKRIRVSKFTVRKTYLVLA